MLDRNHHFRQQKRALHDSTLTDGPTAFTADGLADVLSRLFAPLSVSAEVKNEKDDKTTGTKQTGFTVPPPLKLSLAASRTAMTDSGAGPSTSHTRSQSTPYLSLTASRLAKAKAKARAKEVKAQARARAQAQDAGDAITLSATDQGYLAYLLSSLSDQIARLSAAQDLNRQCSPAAPSSRFGRASCRERVSRLV